MQGFGNGALCLSSSLFKPLNGGYIVRIVKRDMNPGNVGAMYAPKPHCGVRVFIWVL